MDLRLAPMTLTTVINYLRQVEDYPSVPTLAEVEATLAKLKTEAVAAHDEQAAKSLWCWEQALYSQQTFLAAFKKLQSGKYYEAWCDLDRVEIALGGLERHFDKSLWHSLKLDFIKVYTERWQSLFPYRIFFSPEMVHCPECSICGQPFRPRKSCGHTVGEIYGGEMCVRVIAHVDAILGVALVENPVQRYSVAFPSNGGGKEDNFKYNLLNYAVGTIKGPFHEWSYTKTSKRQPHSLFPDAGPSSNCPCDSEKPYSECCLKEEGVLRPHFDFVFSVPPPEGTPQEIYVA